MIFDAHIHQHYSHPDDPAEFLKMAAAGGISGGNILSEKPKPVIGNQNGDFRWQARLEKVLSFTARAPGYYPFFWIDPLAPDAEEQIKTAVENNIAGFKIICQTFYPCEALRTCSIIGETGKPLMFHSGILGGSRDQISGKYNRPMEFECMFSVRGLKFSLAHVGWPWVEDYIGMAAKSIFTYDPDFGNEMFFDLTPGTPGINRSHALRQLYLSGYNVKHKVLWGTDGISGAFPAYLPQFWLAQDREIMEQIGRDAELAMLPGMQAPPDLSDIFTLATEENHKRFLGIC